MATPSTTLQQAREPGVLPQGERDLRKAFLEEINRIPGGGRLNQCIQCGVCTGTCPVSYTMDYSPRAAVALFRAGAIETLLRSRTLWICASCYHCTTRCPAGIKITDLLYALKRISIDKKILPYKFPLFAMSETFVNMVRKFGRNHEMGLLARYFLLTSPFKMLSRIGLGFTLLSRGRLPWRPHKIKGIRELQRMISRAETFDCPQEKVDREKITDAVGYRSIGK